MVLFNVKSGKCLTNYVQCLMNYENAQRITNLIESILQQFTKFSRNAVNKALESKN